MKFFRALPYGIFLCSLAPLSAGPDYTPQINQAMEYFRRKIPTMDADSYIELTRLVRLYNLPIDLAVVRARIMKNLPAKGSPWMRDLDDNYRPGEIEIRSRKGQEWLMLSAMYCDVYPLPWNFLTYMREFSGRGGYAITRSIFALAIAEWRSCRRDEKAFAEEKRYLVNKLPETVQHTPAGSELWVECVLSLFLTGNHDWVTRDTLSLLAGTQSPDGSWSRNPRTTARALWIFLEARRTSGSTESLHAYFLRRMRK